MSHWLNTTGNALEYIINGLPSWTVLKGLAGRDVNSTFIREMEEKRLANLLPTARTGTGRAASSSLSLGTTSVNFGDVILRDPSPWIAKSRKQHAEAKRAAIKLGIDVTPLQLVKDAELFHFDTGANQQGRCVWFSYPVLNPSEMDQICLKYADNFDSVATAAQLNYIHQQFYWRNASTAKCELDCWQLWPKRDIVRSSLVEFKLAGAGSATPLSDAWFYGKDPAYMQYGYAPFADPPDNESGTYNTADVKNSNADYKVSPMPFNDWFASPYENSYITENFRIEYKFNRVFNPGDEMMVTTGVPNQLLFPFNEVEIATNPVQNDEAYKRLYAHMRRCGPITLFRMRGRLAHLHPSMTAPIPTFGLFSMDMVAMRSICSNKVEIAVDALIPERGVFTTGAPSSLGQGATTDTYQFFGAAPSGAIFNN